MFATHLLDIGKNIKWVAFDLIATKFGHQNACSVECLFHHQRGSTQLQVDVWGVKSHILSVHMSDLNMHIRSCPHVSFRHEILLRTG